MQKKNRLEFKHSDEVASKLDELRQLSGMKSSDIISSLILGAEIRQRVPIDYAKLSRELNYIGNNINQVTMNIHYKREIGQQDLQTLSAKLDKCYELLHLHLTVGNYDGNG